MSNPYLSQIERGLRRPSADILANIARGLQISAESLYVRAGILDGDAVSEDPETNLEDAIRHARELHPDQRKALLGVYRSFVAVNRSASDADLATTAESDDD
ncbi:MAG: helix-turn-helix transcriptional regulator [Acidimicrobiales bacterium]